MKRLFLWFLIAALAAVASGCVHTRHSVFPPTVNIAQLEVLPDGHWQLRLRILNNGYDTVTFHTLDLTLLVHQQPAASITRKLELTIPPLSADEAQVNVRPDQAAAAALASIANRGSSGALPYTLRGHTMATPAHDHKTQRYAIDSHNWLSAVPGVANRYR